MDEEHVTESQWSKIATAVILPNFGGWLTSTLGHYGAGQHDWYKRLVKPSYTPPSWTYAPIWTAMYSSMGYASYLVWRDGGGFKGDAMIPLTAYGIQLALNMTWTPLFFGLHEMKLAVADCLLLIPAIAVTAELFRRVNPMAGGLMLPYLAWTTFAALLTFEIWHLNRDKKD